MRESQIVALANHDLYKCRSTGSPSWCPRARARARAEGGEVLALAVLWNARDAVMTNIFSEIQTAAPVLGVTVQPLGVQEGKDIDDAIAAMTEERPDALFMITRLAWRHSSEGRPVPQGG